MPEAAHGPTPHDTEIKPWLTGTNRDPFGVNKLPERGNMGTSRNHVRSSLIGGGQHFYTVDGYKLISAHGFCQV